MKIELVKREQEKDFQMTLSGRLDEINIVIEAMENSVNATREVQGAIGYLRRKLNELKTRK